MKLRLIQSVACVVSILVAEWEDSEEFRRALAGYGELGHVTVEVFLRREADSRQIAEVPGDR